MRQANVIPNVDFPETVHNFISNRPVEFIMMTIQVIILKCFTSTLPWNCYCVLQADRATFTSRMTTMVNDIAADFVGLSLHCFSDGNQSLERVLQERSVSVLQAYVSFY